MKNVSSSDLLIVDFIPLYESAVTGSLDSFNRLKARIEAILRKRAAEGGSEKALLVADARAPRPSTVSLSSASR